MREHLVGYLLNCLDEGTHRAVEARLTQDPEARRALARLREALAPLAADRADPEPPRDQVERMLARIGQCPTQPELPRAPRMPRAFVGDRPFWRRADLIVAASLVLLVAGLTALAVFQVRKGASIIACQDNLRELHAGLEAYHRQHGHYPNVATVHSRAVAGLAVPMLVKAGCLPRDANVRCPENGPAAGCPLTLEELLALPDDEFNRQAPRLVTCYAYDLGYREDGFYYGPRHPNERGRANVPLMADRPASDVFSGNSPNHGGLGQNVLFHDGHVVFLKIRLLGSDDFYLNNRREAAAGDGPFDAVLGASDTKP